MVQHFRSKSRTFELRRDSSTSLPCSRYISLYPHKYFAVLVYLQFETKVFNFHFRKWLESENKFFLVGIVTGNPSRSCDRKTLPDVYNFVANEKVNIKGKGDIFCPSVHGYTSVMSCPFSAVTDINI